LITKKENEINILGLCTENASSYHRIIIPLNAIHGTIVTIDGVEYKYNCTIKKTPNEGKFFTEEDVKNYDIIAYNWIIVQDANTLAVWAQKYNTKIWLDLDDYWVLPENHVNRTTKGIREFYPYLSTTIIRQVSTSDLVTTTNDLLLSDVVPYSSFCGSSFNNLPIGVGQFIPKPEIERKDVITLGVMGSVSHINDYQSISGVWKKISADVEIKNKCRLLIIGADKGDVHWKKIIDMFSVNNFNVEVVEFALPDRYMDLMNEVDVMLAPLEDSEFNERKSGLKLIECAIKGIPVLSNSAYAKKQDFNSYILCKKMGDWYKSIKQLIKKHEDGEYEFQKIGKTLSEQNLKNNNFEERINKIKAGIEYILTTPYTLDENLKIFGIMYDAEKQFTEYTPVLNENKANPWRFEYSVMLNKLEEIKSFNKEDYVSFLSHKFPQKMGISSKLLDKMFRQHKFQEWDVINLARNYWGSGENYLKFSYQEHPHLEKILKMCLDKLEVEYIENPKVVTYSNFYIFKKDVMIDYIENWVKPITDYMENEIWDLVNTDAIYPTGLSSEELEKYTGMTFYNNFTFVMERLVLFFIAHNNLKVKNIG